MRFSALLLFLLSSAFLFGKKEQKVEDQMVPGYNAPSRIFLKKGYNVYTTSTFLYMQAREDGLNYALSNPSGAQFSPNVGGRFIDADFQYKPGFRVGLGYLFTYDDWDVYAEYTRFKQSTKASSASPSGGSLITLWLQNQGFASNASANWRLSMNILDLELGRGSFIGKDLTMRPYFGTRALWIDQNYNVKYLNVIPAAAGGVFSSEAISRNKSDSWAIGPRFGIDTRWLLGKGIRLNGNFAASLIYSSFDVTHRENNSTGTLPAFNIKKCPDFLKPNVELSLGLGWGTFFHQERFHIDLSADYEFHVFWNQNEMNNFGSFTYGGGGVDLNLHGIGIRLRFDF